MTISQRIFMILKEKRLKQKDLSEYTGISTSAISAWNKNNLNPAADKLSIIADFLGVSLSYLITGQEENKMLSNDIDQLIKNYSAVDEISKKLIQERAAALAELAAERVLNKKRYNPTVRKSHYVSQLKQSRTRKSTVTLIYVPCRRVQVLGYILRKAELNPSKSYILI